ncbi:MAG TPA: adenylyl-sulfate kinase, partial [Rhizomicrobium sp.]|nr:adenylyl-sulfate kinase [Rhizomicrobium sp.]
RRVGEAARLFVDAGLIVLTAFISPFRSERRMARELVGEAEFLEVFIDTPIEVCMQRDPKGLYEKAKAGKIKNFTGIDSPYETPERAEIIIKTTETSPEDHAQAIVKHLREKGYLG